MAKTRLERMTERADAVQAAIGRLRGDSDKVFAMCPAPPMPAYDGHTHMEAAGATKYFVPVVTYPSAIPVFAPRVPKETYIDRLYAGRGERSVWGRERVTRYTQASKDPIDFRPMTRQQGVLVTLTNVWDRGETRMAVRKLSYVDSDGRHEVEQPYEAKGDWVVLMTLQPWSTPLAAGIKTVYIGF